MLVLTLLMQVRILGRLDDIAQRPVRSFASAGSAVSVSPSASAIATEVRRQMARDEPPSFSFQLRGSGSRNQQLLNAKFRMIRKAGPASDLSIKATSGIVALLEKIQPTDGLNDSDFYEISFKPESEALPGSWTFSVSYTDHDEKAQERVFEVAYHPDKKPPEYLQVTERND